MRANVPQRMPTTQDPDGVTTVTAKCYAFGYADGVRLLHAEDAPLLPLVDTVSRVSAALSLPIEGAIFGALAQREHRWHVPVLLWARADPASIDNAAACGRWREMMSAIDAGWWANVNGHLNRLLGRNHVCAIVGCKEGSQRFTSEVQRKAFAAGRLAAMAGFTVLTGGLSGVMSKAAEGAASVGGATIGILPGTHKADGNPHLREVLPSGIGIARNYQIALGCDVMIALNGGRGTLEEMCFALDFDKAVATWNSWDVEGAQPLTTDEQVLQFLLANREQLIARLLIERGELAP